MIAWTAPAGEEPVASSQPAETQPRRERLPSRFSQLEGNWPASLLLNDCGAEPDRVAEVDIENAQANEVTASQLAVDCDIEHRKVANAALVLQPGPDSPNVLWLKRRLRSNDSTVVSRIREWSRDLNA